jgi:hypothetical protein
MPATGWKEHITDNQAERFAHYASVLSAIQVEAGGSSRAAREA